MALDVLLATGIELGFELVVAVVQRFRESRASNLA
jgi:hypothetical protein